MRVFEPLTAEQHAHPSTASYLKAFGLLEASDARAMTAFAAHLGSYSDDKLGSFHLRRLLNGAAGAQVVMQ